MIETENELFPRERLIVDEAKKPEHSIFPAGFYFLQKNMFIRAVSTNFAKLYGKICKKKTGLLAFCILDAKMVTLLQQSLFFKPYRYHTVFHCKTQFLHRAVQMP